MLFNYFKIALRNLWRHKLLSGINIMGLSTGIACCLLIALYIFHETSYDRFHKNAGRIVRATMELSYGGTVTNVAVTGTKVLPEFKRVFPEVENGVRTFPTTAVISYGTKTFRENQFVYADSAFFQIFSFSLLQGNPKEVLTKPDQLVLTTSTARKYFGNEDAIGKMVRVNNERDYVVSGVVEDCPSNSQIKFDVLASWSSLTDPVYTTESWFDASHYTYLLLEKPGMAKTLEAKIPDYFKSKDASNDINGKDYLTIHVQPLTEVHLKALAEGGFEPGGDERYIYIFSVIALFILCIACANYINLTTARASERAKEVGLRKVVGASRKKLIAQFMGESLITVLVASLISLLLVELLLPLFNVIASKQLTTALLLTPAIEATLICILILIAFFGGLYPSLMLSGFSPVNVLKGNFKTSSSGTALRKGLIILQFVISTGLIVSTLIIHNQLSYIQNKKLGYDKDHIVVLRSDESVVDKMETVKTTLLSNPDVLGVTICNQTPVFIPGKYNFVLNGQETLITAVRVDKDFIRTMGLHIQSGTEFTGAEEKAAFAGTDTIQRPLILNEAAVRSFGWTNEDAVGKTVKFQGRNSIVKGVVADFHFTSMHEVIGPFVIFLGNYNSRILVKLSGRHLAQTLRDMEKKWNGLASHLPFDYEFLDDQFDKLYSAETRTGKIFYVFAILGIGLACSGLLGLITFTSQQRTKEIGIRKVLGASTAAILTLLSKDLIKLVAIATLISMPASWWAMERWLQSFAYRAPVHAWIFLLTGTLAIALAALPVCLQALRAALANPVESLRTE